MTSKIKQGILWVLICALLICMAAPAFAEGTGSKRTIMVYMCGSNLESDNGQGSTAIGEILDSKFNTEEINVVLLLGGSRKWMSGYDTDQLTVLEMTNRRPRTVDSFELASMGDPETLSHFLNYCYENYPAENYDLIIWDHGGGPIYGVCQDMISKDMMYLDELCTAMENSPFAQEPLDILAFNACLMGSAEVAANMAPYAQYMVATEDSMYGLSYGWLTDADQYEDPKDLAISMADSSFQLNQEIIEAQNAPEINAVSVIDLSKAAALSGAMDEFFQVADAQLNEDTFTDISNDRRDTVAFGLGDSGEVSGFDLVDVGDMISKVREMEPKLADNVQQAIQDAVVYLQSAREECSGLTTYYPFLNKDELAERMAIYNDLGFASEYNSYLQNFTSILNGVPLADWIDLITGTAVTRDNRVLFSLKLNEDQARHLGQAQLDVLHMDEQGNYTFTFANPTTLMDEENRLTGEFSGTALYALDETGAPVTRELEYRLDRNGRYLIPAALHKTDEDGEEVLHQALITCTLEKDENGKHLIPGTIQVWEEDLQGYTSAYQTTLEDYDSLDLTVTSRIMTRNENGTLLDYWKWDPADTETFSLNIDGSWQFGLLNDTLDTGELYATFQVTDSQNNVYASEPLVLETEQSADTETRISYDDANLIMINSLAVNPAEGGLSLNGNVENLTSAEAVIHLENLTVNGNPLEAVSDVFGSGENWGLLEGEEQMLLLSIPAEDLAEVETVTEISFDLTSEDAVSGEIQGTVPVQIVLNLDLR